MSAQKSLSACMTFPSFKATNLSPSLDASCIGHGYRESRHSQQRHCCLCAVPGSWLGQALIGPRLVAAMQDSMAAACGQVVRNTTTMQVCCPLGWCWD